MRVGFRTLSVTDIEMASKLGFEVVEPFWDKYAWAHKDKIRKKLEKHKIHASAVLTAVERNYNQLEKDIEYCVSLSANFDVNTVPASLMDLQLLNMKVM